MTPERYREVGQIFRAAAEIPPDRRDAFLDAACGEDQALRQEVRSLLDHDSRAEGWIDKRALDVAAQALASAPAESWVGRQVQHYQVSSLLGRGGMGEVYRARDTKLKRDVAIKILPDEFSRDADRVRRFQREAEVLASLNHPNIAAIYDLQEANSSHFLVLELVEGETLAHRIKQGPIPVDEALRLAIEIAEALEAAHAKGVIHRDLKPANIKIAPEGRIKVLDFGLALTVMDESSSASLSDSPALSRAGQGVVLGTVAYMSPEQAKGGIVDRRTDIFTFGSVLYEMLTGRAAFEGEDVPDILGAVLKNEPDWTRLPAKLPPMAMRLLRRCLKKDRAERVQHIGDVRLELQDLISPTESSIMGAPERWRGLSWMAAAASVVQPMLTEEAESKAARRQLERVLASPGFARNERLSRFLRFVVEGHLEGKDREVKESLLAIEVFGRSPGYDPKQDPIVRTEASRLRARLSEYYLGEGKEDPLIIELPKGGYVPTIRPSQHRPETTAPLMTHHSESPLRKWLLVRRVWIGAGLACLVVALAAVGWWHPHPEAPIPIAVLPLINLNQEPSTDYFADGLTSEIIRNLSIIDGLAARSESSSFALKGKPQKARDAGRQLEADYLVEGSVLRSGQQLRVNVQLVRVSDDFPLWSGRYDRELTDIFAIQDEISLGIVNNLRLKFGRGRRRYETSTEAYDLYLRARALKSLGISGRPQSIPLFEQAIAKDPSFAPAYAGLAEAHAVLSGNAAFDIPQEVEKLHAAAEKAIELDPLSAESYDALGAAYARDGRWEQSEKSFRRAIALQPKRADSHTHFASFYLLPLGRIDEAIQQLRIAESNDPLAPEVLFFLGDALADAGRDDDAARYCEKLPPENTNRETCILGARVRQGRASEVVRIYRADPAKRRDPSSPLGCAYARMGRREEAVEEAERIAPTFPGGDGGAQIFACLGEKDGVFEALDRKAGNGPIRIGWFLLRVDRENRGLLRGDPRLRALRKKVGLPE